MPGEKGSLDIFKATEVSIRPEVGEGIRGKQYLSGKTFDREVIELNDGFGTKMNGTKVGGIVDAF